MIRRKLTCQSTFYATETAMTRMETVYYPHTMWASATAPHFDLLAHAVLEQLNPVSRSLHVQRSCIRKRKKRRSNIRWVSLLCA